MGSVALLLQSVKLCIHTLLLAFVIASGSLGVSVDGLWRDWLPRMSAYAAQLFSMAACVFYCLIASAAIVLLTSAAIWPMRISWMILEGYAL